jgi:hypothetical protein
MRRGRAVLRRFLLQSATGNGAIPIFPLSLSLSSFLFIFIFIFRQEQERAGSSGWSEKPDERGKISGGRHRFRLCQQLQVSKKFPSPRFPNPAT